MRIKRPDKKNALSIVQAAERDMEFTMTLPLTDAASATIVRNIYESFRMLGDALLVLKGISSTDHAGPIKELLTLRIRTTRSIYALDNLRQLRHNINYSGYKPTSQEVENALSLSRDLFRPLVDEIKKLLGPSPLV